MRTSNELKHHRRLTPEWYQGTTGIVPFDDLVSKLRSHGYVSSSERLKIATSLMIISEIHPQDMHHFFDQLFVDSYDWVTTPNLYRSNSFITNKAAPADIPVCSSSKILEISNYQKGDWCDVWDGLYWRFIEAHKDKLKQIQSMRSQVQEFEKLDPDHKRIVGYRADDFLNNLTS